jgi:hypothetical protein
MKRFVILSLLSLGCLPLFAQPTLRGPLTTNSPIVKAAYDGGLIDAATNNLFRVPVGVNTNLVITNLSVGQVIRIDIWCTNGFTCAFPQQTPTNSVQGWIRPVGSNAWQSVFVSKPAAGETNFDVRAVDYLDAGGAGITLATNFATGVRTIASAAYTLQMAQISALSPADSTTFYFGAAWLNPATSTFTDQRVYIPRAGTLKTVFVRVRVSGTLGSSESVSHYIRLNDATDITLNTTNQYTVAAWSSPITGLNQSLAEGDYVVLKVVSPAWVTNPTSVSWTATLYIE